MEENYKRAIEMLQKKVEWLAKNNKLQTKQLNDYNFILKSLVDFYNYAEEKYNHEVSEHFELQMQVDKVNQKAKKLTLILQMAGFGRQLIERIMEMPVYYLENECQHAIETDKYLQNDMIVTGFMLDYIKYNNRINSDMDALKTYQVLIITKRKHTNNEEIQYTCATVMQTMRESLPYLSAYFNRINDDPDIVNNQSFTHQIRQTLLSRHLCH